VKLDGLLWAKAEDADALGRGPPPLPAGADGSRGWRLRTDHVSLRTDVAWPEAVRLARVAETHVLRLFAEHGDALDLRFPDAPLPVVVHARRADFARDLAAAGEDAASWGAWYDARRGTVLAAAEPAASGPLPLDADLRHEMTHQALDLSTPAAGRHEILAGHHLWLWEGFAVVAEGLGTAAPGPARERRERFERRRRLGDVLPLHDLFVLPQAVFEGRHYDQAGSLVAFLMADGVPGGRAATLATLRDLLRGTAGRRAFLERVGLPASDLEARWLRSLGP
jgi:hypothetical protein